MPVNSGFRRNYFVILRKMKKKILVVESDRDIQEIISYILKEEGYEPVLCYPDAEIIEII